MTLVLRSVVVSLLLLAQVTPVTADIVRHGSGHRQDTHCGVLASLHPGHAALDGTSVPADCQKMPPCRQVEPAVPGVAADDGWWTPPGREAPVSVITVLSTAAERPPTPPPNR